MITKPVPVPEKTITSIDVVNFASGLNLNGPQIADTNAFVASQDVALTPSGHMVPRPVLTPFLANTVDTVYQLFPVIWNGVVYFVTADAITAGETAGRIIYCKEGDTTWTVAGAATGSTNTVTVNNGGKPEFLRALDTVLVLNGQNGDRLAFLDLTTTPFQLRQAAPIADPAVAMTAAASGGITGATTSSGTNPYILYYAYSYETSIGSTNLSPILTYYTSITRDQWQGQSTPGKVTVTKPGTAPSGALSWTLYVGISATGGTVSSTNLFPIAQNLDLATAAFIDDASLGINLGSPSPVDNSTAGPRVSHGITEEGNPILFGDIDIPQNIWIGGGGINALSFAAALNGYTAQPNLGTNYMVTSLVGFRNGQGVPSLTVLYSNTQGVAEQAVLSQQNVTYGGISFSIWSTTAQHYGAAGVAAPDSAINYNGKLVFMSTNGMMSMNTQPLRQNVISTDNLTIKTMQPFISQIKNSAMGTIVGTAWDNRFLLTMPTGGFDTPQQILVMDDNNKVAENDNNGAFYTYDIPAQWIDIVTPNTEGAFIYICQGNQSFKLSQGNATFDIKGGVPVPFATGATGPLIPMGSPAHNRWQADVQVMFYVMGLVGTITVGVNYYNQNGKLKTKSKVYVGPSYVPTVGGGWGDGQWTYGNFPAIPGWGYSPEIDTTLVALQPVDVRIPVQIDDEMNEAQWWFSTEAGFNNYKIRAISFEGIDLGVKPDLQ